jgi:predicted  nucleic acid-binding Zn-ribbon protein
LVTKVSNLQSEKYKLQSQLEEMNQRFVSTNKTSSESITLDNHQEELENVHKKLQDLQASEKKKDQHIIALEQEVAKLRKQETMNKKHSDALQLENEYIASKESRHSVETNGPKRKRRSSKKKHKQ